MTPDRVRDVFVDTSALVALLDESDGLHRKALAVERELAGSDARMVVSEEVLVEFLGFAARPSMRAGALGVVDAILASPSFEVVWASRERFVGALELYRSRRDKAWSLVDCSSMIICEARGIRRVFTHDRHFVQAGFVAMLK